MLRVLLTIAIGLAATAPALAQDMPLSQILIDGEGWKKVEGPGKKPEPISPDHVVTRSADRGTVFVFVPGERFLRAVSVSADGTLAPNAPRFGAAYCPLRTRRGETTIDVTSLATDKDGRIYAATEIGVQVFDPTGRLCGVLTPAASGKPEAMAFEGDKLTLWIGDTKYARKLRTEGLR